MKKKCQDCGNEIDVADPIPGFETFWRLPVSCVRCQTKRDEEKLALDTANARQEVMVAWRKKCPSSFQDTEIQMLPFPEKALETLRWKYGKRGLILHGKTRRGKSRCAWLLLKREFEAGQTIQILDSMAGFQYGAAFANGAQQAQEWVDKKCKCGLLFFDDVFKAKLTDSFEAAVFAIVDYRLSHCLPILATLNDTGETLAARMSSDRGDALVARLKEMCDVITF